MYDINAELGKIDGAMLRTKDDLESCKALLSIINKRYNTLLKELESSTLDVNQSENIAAFLFYLNPRKDLLAERIDQLKSVHPSRIDSLGQVLPWDTEDSLLNWKRKT
jgi:hypothetical protein